MKYIKKNVVIASIILIAVMAIGIVIFSAYAKTAYAPAPKQTVTPKIDPQAAIIVVPPVKPPMVVNGTRLTGPEANADQLERFLTGRKCLDADQSGQYIDSARLHGIDWRLLPAISVLESSCGKHYINNNLWGWASGQKKFTNFAEGIEFISTQIGESRTYAPHTTEGILKVYNNHPGYPERIESIMEQISSTK